MTGCDSSPRNRNYSFVLLLVFYQDVNSVQYELKNGEHNGMGIVEVVL